MMTQLKFLLRGYQLHLAEILKSSKGFKDFDYVQIFFNSVSSLFKNLGYLLVLWPTALAKDFT